MFGLCAVVKKEQKNHKDKIEEWFQNVWSVSEKHFKLDWVVDMDILEYWKSIHLR